MRNRLVPNQQWGAEVAEDFAAEPDPILTCYVCATDESEIDSKSHIVLYQGTSYCISHIPI